LVELHFTKSIKSTNFTDGAQKEIRSLNFSNGVSSRSLKDLRHTENKVKFVNYLLVGYKRLL
jgi:hypothetical protein